MLKKESELDHVESDKLNMNDKMELLKSKMDAAMKTNKRLLDNATNTINEHMEMNIKLVKEKETLSITIENLKRSLKSSENEAKHLRKQVKTIKEGEDIIRDKLAGAMATMTNLNSSAMISLPTPSSFGKKSQGEAQTSRRRVTCKI